jgi:hypothetical protein
MANDGAIYYVPVTFGSAALRKITLELPNNALWGGIQIGPADSIYAPETKGPKVVVVGDSFTEGSGATIYQQWWAGRWARCWVGTTLLSPVSALPAI